MKQWNRLLKLVLFVFITRNFMSHIYGSSVRLLFSLLVLAGIFFFMLFPEEMEVKSVFGKTKKAAR